MANLFGKFITAAISTAGQGEEPGSVLISLCGYGTQVPKTNQGTVVRLEQQFFQTPGDPNFGWTAIVSGNDVIRPEQTYYTLTYKNSNGDIAQCEAYLFQDANQYDMDLAQPFDPSLPPAVIPPLIIPQAEIANGGPSYEFAGDEFATFIYNLDQNATVGVSNPVIGNLYTFIIHQDATGSHTLTWPYYIVNATPINPEPNGTTIQTFVASERLIQGQLILYSIAPPTWWTT